MYILLTVHKGLYPSQVWSSVQQLAGFLALHPASTPDYSPQQLAFGTPPHWRCMIPWWWGWMCPHPLWAWLALRSPSCMGFLWHKQWWKICNSYSKACHNSNHIAGNLAVVIFVIAPLFHFSFSTCLYYSIIFQQFNAPSPASTTHVSGKHYLTPIRYSYVHVYAYHSLGTRSSHPCSSV